MSHAVSDLALLSGALSMPNSMEVPSMPQRSPLSILELIVLDSVLTPATSRVGIVSSEELIPSVVTTPATRNGITPLPGSLVL